MLSCYSPISPEHMDWSSYYPAFVLDTPPEQTDLEASTVKRLKPDVEVADIGCGFGGLLVALAPLMPDTLILGRALLNISELILIVIF